MNKYTSPKKRVRRNCLKDCPYSHRKDGTPISTILKKKQENSGGSTCGGVISQSMDREMTKKYGVHATMMYYILPDIQYKKYISLKKLGKGKEANKIFEQFRHSII